MDGALQVLLSEADRAIGRLDAATELLPNPDLFVAMYVRKEAVLSSQIEGTQASLIDLLEYEAEAARRGGAGDVREVFNYVRALDHGLGRLGEMPMSLRLIREIHGVLLLDHLFRQPMLNVNRVAGVIGRTYPVANDLVATFEGLGILAEVTGRRRNRVYAYRPCLDLME